MLMSTLPLANRTKTVREPLNNLLANMLIAFLTFKFYRYNLPML